jgi:hypothetical protein
MNQRVRSNDWLGAGFMTPFLKCWQTVAEPHPSEVIA